MIKNNINTILLIIIVLLLVYLNLRAKHNSDVLYHYVERLDRIEEKVELLDYDNKLLLEGLSGLEQDLGL